MQGNSSTNVTPNPVIVATGEKIKSAPDFAAAGRYGLGLEGIYRSKNAMDSLFGPT